MTRLERIKELESKIDKGPWTYEVEDYSPEHVRGPHGVEAIVVGGSAETEYRAHFIAAMRSDVPWLIEMVEEAKEIIDRAKTIAGDEQEPTDLELACEKWQRKVNQ